MKEQKNLPVEELEEMEASNLSDRKFRVMIIRLLDSTSSQDKGIGRHALLPCTARRRTTTNLKTKTTRTSRKSNCMEVRKPRG